MLKSVVATLTGHAIGPGFCLQRITMLSGRFFPILAGFITLFQLALPAQTGEKAAEVNGSPILLSEVDDKLGNNLNQLQQQIHDMRQKQLDMLIDQKLLEIESSRLGITIAELVRNEITSKVAKATTEEAEKFYQDNKDRIQGEFKDLEEQIRNYLTTQRLQFKQREYIKALRAAAKIKPMLPAPPIYRFEVSLEGAPLRGPANAPVTVIEFSDFHCPFCKRTKAVLDELRSRYADKVKFAFRDFPLDSLHPAAHAAADAAHCAQEQNKFWEFRDELFKIDADASAETLAKLAKTTGMDVSKFQSCTSSGKYKSAIEASTQDGVRLGITGTPTFFINGRMLVGAQPLDAFIKIIEQELAAAAPAAR
jgi:protein-disulfide isomerase